MIADSQNIDVTNISNSNLSTPETTANISRESDEKLSIPSKRIVDIESKISAIEDDINFLVDYIGNYNSTENPPNSRHHLFNYAQSLRSIPNEKWKTLLHTRIHDLEKRIDLMMKVESKVSNKSHSVIGKTISLITN
jgi:hypothetical protein